ncbi:MAG: prevent-host-death protein [Actinomycetia bacterium]|nr:prevent-host-death protein [Actinomycetes bacterium]
MSAMQYDTFSEARKHFKDLFDAAEAGRPTSIRRERRRTALVDADRLRAVLVDANPSNAEVVAEAGGWSAFVPGLPIAADAATFTDAVDELVIALREYADDWADHLRHAPDHADNWGLIQIIDLSSDGQLRDWVVG